VDEGCRFQREGTERDTDAERELLHGAGVLSDSPLCEALHA